MELIKSRAKRSKISDVVYIILNLLFAGAVFGLTVAFQPPIAALLLVLLSKWRIFAVRPRFWFANIQANLVDIFVGLSVVVLIWQASGVMVLQVMIALLYALWLLFLKPRSRRKYMVWQAGIAQFVALTALFSNTFRFDVAFAVLCAWLIGYVTARHVLSTYDSEKDEALLALAWGLALAELAWIAGHWTIGYRLAAELMIPQIAIIAAALGLLGLRLYEAYCHPSSRSQTTIRTSTIFALVVIGIMLIRELSATFQIMM